MEKLSASLPTGFGFHPTDAELVSHYLKRKILGHKLDELIPVVDIYKHEPWDLPVHFAAKCRLPTRDSKWHFFALRDRKYPNGSRSNRATEEGYWKSTGKDRNVKFQNRVIGTKKTLVFHEGRPPCGKRTDWIMHEFYINEKECKGAPGLKDIFVLCRVTKRNGWQLESEEVSAQNDETSSLQQPQRIIEPVVLKESSTHSGDIEDIDAWVAELFDPNFGAPSSELEHEAENLQEDLTSAPKQEPVDSCLYQSAEDDNDFLLEDDIFSILQSHSEHLNLLFEESNIGTTDAAFTTGSTFLDENAKKVNTTSFGHTVITNSYESTGIQTRERGAGPSAEVPSHRIRLQVSKMEARNTISVNHTVKFEDEDHHLDLNKSNNNDFSSGLGVNQDSAVAKASVSSSDRSDTKSNPSSCSDQCPPASRALMGENSAKDVTVDDTSFIQRILRGLGMFARAFPSSGLNCFILSACLAGTAAVIIYFLLRDAQRFQTNF